MQKVELKNVLKLVNPLKENVFPELKKISVDEIEKTINNLDFVEVPGEDRKNLIRKIAFQVKNPVHKPLVLNFGYPERGEESANLVEDGLIELFAASVRKDESLHVEIKGSLSFAKTLLGIEQIEELFAPLLEADTSLNPLFVWSVSNELKARTWGNKTFAMEKLTQNFKKYISFIESSLWQDEEFLNFAIQKANEQRSLTSIPHEVLHSVDTFNTVKHNPLSMLILWEQVYIPLLNRPSIEDHGIGLKKEELYDNNFHINHFEEDKFSYMSEKELTLLQKKLLKRQKNEFTDFDFQEHEMLMALTLQLEEREIMRKEAEKYKPLIESIKSLFENKEWFDFMVKEEMGRVFYAYVNQAFRTPEITLSVLKEKPLKFEKESYKKAVSAIPSGFFTTPENIASFYQNHSFNDFSRNPGYTSWVKNRVLFSQTIMSLPASSIEQITSSKEFPTAYFTDRSLVEKLLNATHNIYILLPSIMQADEDMLRLYISKGGTDVKPSYLFDIEDPLLWKRAIELNHSLLRSTNCPSELKEDFDILVLLGRDIHDFSWSHRKMEQIVGNGENRFTRYMTLLHVSTELYEYFPDDIKANETVCRYYINNAKDNVFRQKPPASVWASRDFCLYAIVTNDTWISSVPGIFWQDKTFIMEVAKLVDSGALKDTVFEKGNNEIKKFFDSLDIHNNYSSFLLSHALSLELKEKKETNPKKLKI